MAEDLQAGSAYIQILPSMRGFFRRIQSEVRGGAPVQQDIEPRVNEQALARARQQMERAAEQVAAARRKEADSAGAVRTAEAALEDLRSRAGARASQIVAAEERVAAARRRSEAAMESLQAAERRERSATGRVERLELRADSSQADAEVEGFVARTQRRMGDLAGAAKFAAAAGLAAAGAALGAGLVGAINVEAAQGKVRAQLGLTEQESARVGAVAGALFSNAYGGSMEEVNDAVGSVISSIDGMRTASSEALEAATAKALDFATTFEVDVQSAVQSVGTLMRAGLAGDATEAFDLVTAASQRVPAALRENVLEASDEYGQFFATLGFNGEQAFAMLVDASAKGEFGIDKIGDAVKEFTIRSTDMSKSSTDAYKAIGLDAETMANKILAGGDTAQGATQQIITGLLSMKNPSEQAAAAIALFGTPLEDLNTAEIPAFLQSMTGASKSMEGWQGSAERMGQALNDNAATNIEAFKRQISTTFIDLVGGRVLPALAGVAAFLATSFGPALDAVGGFVTNVVVPGFQAFGAWVQQASGWLVPLAVTIGVVALALNAATIATTVWGAVTAGASAVMAFARGAVLSFQVAVWLLNAAMLANPVGIVVALIAGLVAGLVVAYNTSETFRNIVNGVWQSFLTVAGPALEFLRNLISTVWASISATFMSAVATIGGIWSGFWAALGPVFSAAWAYISAIITGAWEIVKAIFQTAMAFLRGDWDGFWNGIAGIAVAVWNAIGGILSAGWELVKALFNAGISFVLAVWGTLWATLQAVLGAAWAVLKAVLAAGWAFLQFLFQSGVQIVVGMWTGFFSTIQSVATTVWNAILGFITTVWGAIRSAFQTAVDFVAGVWSRFWDGLSSVASTVFNAIKGVIDTVMGGIQRAFEIAVDVVGRVWSGIKSLLAKPINFMIQTVYMGGIKKAWDIVAGLLPGIGPAPVINPIPEFAKGGPVRGDQIIRAGEKGDEFVLSAPAIRGLGGMGAVEQLHQQALRRGATSVPELNSGRYVEGADHDGPGSRTSGFGGVRPHVAQAGWFLKNMFGIGSVGGVGQRANASDHPKGLALDFMTYADQGKGDRLVNYLLPRAGHFAVKYVIWKQRINSGSGWRGMADRGSATANHFDHPHVSFLDRPGGGGPFAGGGDGGGFFDIKAWIREQFEKLTNPLINALPGPPPRWMEFPRGMARTIRDRSLDFLLGKTFDNGGLATGRGLMFKNVIAPERTLDPRTTVAFEQLVGYLQRVPGSPSAGPERPGMNQGGVEQRLDRLVGLLEENGAGATITVEDRSGNPVETGRAAAMAIRRYR